MKAAFLLLSVAAIVAAQTPTFVSCNPNTVTSPSTVTCTVYVSTYGGGTVGLTSSSANVSVPATVTVGSSSTSASFYATVSTISSVQTVVITASLNSVSRTFSLALIPNGPVGNMPKQPFINVTAAPYNAKGDGATDDTAAIQEAITDAASSGTLVYLPASNGGYRVSHLTIPTGADNRPVGIVGTGAVNTYGADTAGTHYGTRIKCAVGDGQPCISASATVFSVATYVFRDLTIIGPDTDSPRTTTSGDGLAITGAAAAPNLQMTNVFVSNFFGSGKAAIWLDSVYDPSLTNVRAEYSDIGLKLTNYANGLRCWGCSTRKNASVGLLVNSSDGGEFHGVVESNEKTGIKVTGSCKGWKFYYWQENNNTTHSATDHGIHVYPGAATDPNAFIRDLEFYPSTINIGSGGTATDERPYLEASDTNHWIFGVKFSGGYWAGICSSGTCATLKGYVVGTRFDIPDDVNISYISQVANGGGQTPSGTVLVSSNGSKLAGLQQVGLTSLAGTGNRCLETDASGNIVVAGTGAACGSGSGGSGTFQSTITDLKPTNTSTVLTIAAGRCAGANKSAATCTITAGSGSGSYASYCTDTQAIVVEHSTSAGLTLSCSGATASQVTTPSIPFGMQPIATGTITTGAWGTPTDAREGVGLPGHRHQNGVGMATVCVNGVCMGQVDTASVQMRSDNYTPVSQFDASASTLFRQRELSSDPATCAKGEYYWNTTSTKGRRCTATNTWADDASGGTGNTLMMVSRYAPLAYNTGTVGKNLIDFEYGTSSPSANGQWGTEPAKYGQSFPATGTTQVYYPFQVPANWTGSVIIDAQIWWGQNTTGGASGNYKFDFAVMCQNSNATISTQTYNTASAVTTADQGIHKLQITSATNITSTGCAAGSFGTLRLRRLGDDAADTGTEAAIVLGLGVTLRNQ